MYVCTSFKLCMSGLVSIKKRNRKLTLSKGKRQLCYKQWVLVDQSHFSLLGMWRRLRVQSVNPIISANVVWHHIENFGLYKITEKTKLI